MASTHASLDAAAQERKARLAKLKSLKRKQPDGESNADGETNPDPAVEEQVTVTHQYLSGRNYDVANRAPKLGFEHAPDDGRETMEQRAQEIENETRTKLEAEKADESIDLFKLQPKKPNWDLKRDVEKKLERLNVQTENAIAKIVRQRIQAQKKSQMESGNDSGGGEKVGMQGEELVETLREREREVAEEERREREEIDDI